MLGAAVDEAPLYWWPPVRTARATPWDRACAMVARMSSRVLAATIRAGFMLWDMPWEDQLNGGRFSMMTMETGKREREGEGATEMHACEGRSIRTHIGIL